MFVSHFQTRSLNAANYAAELCSCREGRTWYPTFLTNWLHMVKQSTVSIPARSGKRHLNSINTNKLGAMMQTMRSHKKTKIFSLPASRTVGSSWYHHHCLTRICKAYSTWSIAILTSWKNWIFIFSAEDLSIALNTSTHLKGSWSTWQANVIGCSSPLSKVSASSDARIYSSCSTRTESISPPCEKSTSTTDCIIKY